LLFSGAKRKIIDPAFIDVVVGEVEKAGKPKVKEQEKIEVNNEPS